MKLVATFWRSSASPSIVLVVYSACLAAPIPRLSWDTCSTKSFRSEHCPEDADSNRMASHIAQNGQWCNDHRPPDPNSTQSTSQSTVRPLSTQLLLFVNGVVEVDVDFIFFRFLFSFDLVVMFKEGRTWPVGVALGSPAWLVVEGVGNLFPPSPSSFSDPWREGPGL